MRKFAIILALMLPVMAGAQGVRYDSYAFTIGGSGTTTPILPVKSAQITVCSYPATGGVPCTNTITVYQDQGLTTPCLTSTTGCLVADAQGNFGFWVTPGTYAYTVQGTGIANVTYAFSASPSTNSYWVNAATAAGATVSAQIDAALASCGSTKCTVVIPGSMGTGSATSYPTNVSIEDERAQYQRQLWNITTRTTQTDGFNVEQGLNPTGNVSAFEFGQATELFTHLGNTKNFTGQLNGVYGSANHFGSGTASEIFGGTFEAFNSGPATGVTLVSGVVGNGRNGGLALGFPATSNTPYETPTNNGSVANARGIDGSVQNISSGTITTGAALFAEANTNTGGGAITNNYGVLVSDQTAGVNNWSGFFGAGKFQVQDVALFNSTLQVAQTMGIQTTPLTAVGLEARPALLAGTSQFGIRGYPLCNTQATLICVGVYGRADTSAAAFTAQYTAGLYADTPVIGAGSANGTAYGVYVAPVSGATNNYSIFAPGSSQSFFGGTVNMGGNAAVGGVLTVGQTSSGGAVNTSIGNSAGAIVFHTALTGALTPGQTVTLAGTCLSNLAYNGTQVIILVSNGVDTAYAINTGTSSGACGADAPGSWSLVASGTASTFYGGLKLPSATAGQAACIKADHSIGVCSTAVGAGGACTCN